MDFGISIGLILCGILGAASAIVKKRPEAKDLIEKLSAYQGWIGAITALWGVWGVIWILMNLGIAKIWFIMFLTLLIGAVLSIALGGLLGFGLISKYALSKNEAAMAKAEELRTKLAPYQVTLGYAAIGVGIWALLARFLHIGLG